jgi:hypothetical protein
MSYLDLRDLADEWQEIEDEIVALPLIGRADEWREPFVLLCEQIGCCATPADLRSYGDNYEPTLIPEDEFEDYARELAEDIGAIPAGMGWPLYCIDWERAARELSADYNRVTFRGTDYLIRIA